MAKNNKKTKVLDKKQTHGEEVTDSAWLFSKVTGNDLEKYGTTDPEIYRQKLDAMVISELHAYARKNGVIPVNSREMITASLMNKFNRFLMQFKIVDQFANEKEHASLIKERTELEKDKKLNEILRLAR